MFYCSVQPPAGLIRGVSLFVTLAMDSILGTGNAVLSQVISEILERGEIRKNRSYCAMRTIIRVVNTQFF